MYLVWRTISCKFCLFLLTCEFTTDIIWQKWNHYEVSERNVSYTADNPVKERFSATCFSLLFQSNLFKGCHIILYNCLHFFSLLYICKYNNISPLVLWISCNWAFFKASGSCFHFFATAFVKKNKTILPLFVKKKMSLYLTRTISFVKSKLGGTAFGYWLWTSV